MKKGTFLNYRPNQKQIVFQYLKKHVATASMIADATSVPQKNICRFKRDLEKAGQLWEITKAKCKKTGYTASYLTTNPNYKTEHPVQLYLF